jgi:hypothetical protein
MDLVVAFWFEGFGERNGLFAIAIVRTFLRKDVTLVLLGKMAGAEFIRSGLLPICHTSDLTDSPFCLAATRIRQLHLATVANCTPRNKKPPAGMATRRGLYQVNLVVAGLLIGVINIDRRPLICRVSPQEGQAGRLSYAASGRL